MKDIFFNIPFYQKLTSHEGWKPLDENETNYLVCRAFFILKSRHKAGSAKKGRKLSVIGSPRGVATDKVKSIELETEIFREVETIKKSLIESDIAEKILAEISTQIGNPKVVKVGGKVGVEISSTLKESISSDFRVTSSVRERKTIKYEFKDSIQPETSDDFCAVAAYQQCSADLYLLKIDYLNVVYEKSYFGLRKKVKKYPFPNKNKEHPNIIKLGSYIGTLDYWELLPESSWLIKDANYKPDVENDSEVTINLVDDIKDRPYWSYDDIYPSLYQLANVAFPYKWVKKQHSKYTLDELLDIELGEAEESAWWFRHGPGGSKQSA